MKFHSIEGFTDTQLSERVTYLGTVIAYFEVKLVETLAEIEDRLDGVPEFGVPFQEETKIIPFRRKDGS